MKPRPASSRYDSQYVFVQSPRRMREPVRGRPQIASVDARTNDAAHDRFSWPATHARDLSDEPHRSGSTFCPGLQNGADRCELRLSWRDGGLDRSVRSKIIAI